MKTEIKKCACCKRQITGKVSYYKTYTLHPKCLKKVKENLKIVHNCKVEGVWGNFYKIQKKTDPRLIKFIESIQDD